MMTAPLQKKMNHGVQQRLGVKGTLHSSSIDDSFEEVGRDGFGKQAQNKGASGWQNDCAVQIPELTS